MKFFLIRYKRYDYTTPMHPATIMSFFVINDIIKVHAHARTYIRTNEPYTQKSVKSVHSSRILRASQSPNQVEKQPKSTPDMYSPPTHTIRARTTLLDIHIHEDIHRCCLDFLLNVAKILIGRKQRQ